MSAPIRHNVFTATDALEKGKERAPLQKMGEETIVHTPKGSPRLATPSEMTSSSTGQSSLTQLQEAQNSEHKQLSEHSGQKLASANPKITSVAQPITSQKVELEPIVPSRQSAPTIKKEVIVDPQKAQAQTQANGAAQNIVDTWDAMRTGEQLKKPAYEHELKLLKDEVQAMRQEVTEATDRAKPFQNAPTATFEGHQHVTLLEEKKAKLQELEAKLQLAEKPMKVSYSKETKQLSLVQRNSSAPPKGVSQEGRLAVKKVFHDLKQAHQEGITSFSLKDGSVKYLNELLDMVVKSDYGKAVIKNSSHLKKEVAEMQQISENVEFFNKFEAPIQEGKDILQQMRDGNHQQTIDRLRERLSDRQEQIITHSSLSQIKDPTKQDVSDFFNSLKMDTGGVDADVLKRAMQELVQNPRKIIYFSDGTDFDLESNMDKALAPGGLQHSVGIANEALKEKSAGKGFDEYNLGRTLQMIGSHKGLIKNGLTNLIERTVAFENLNATQKNEILTSLSEALPTQKSGSIEKKGNQWENAFSLLTQVSQLYT